MLFRSEDLAKMHIEKITTTATELMNHYEKNIEERTLYGRMILAMLVLETRLAQGAFKDKASDLLEIVLPLSRHLQAKMLRLERKQS